MQSTEVISQEAAILARVIQPERADLSATAARAILRFRFGESDRARMHELAVKNQSGALTGPEEQELSSYRRIARLLDLLGAKARLALEKPAKGDRDG